MKSFVAILLLAALANFANADLLPSIEGEFSRLDRSGGYHFGFNAGQVSRQEERSVDGVVRGAYSYIDAEGKMQSVMYTADKDNGFQVSGSNIPKIERMANKDDEADVIELPEEIAPVKGEPAIPAPVMENPAMPVPIMEEAAMSAPVMESSELPVPVTDTPEVAAARAEHLEAIRKAIAGEVELPKPEYLMPIMETPEVAAARADHLHRHKLETIRNNLIAPGYISPSVLPPRVLDPSIYWDSVVAAPQAFDQRVIASSLYGQKPFVYRTAQAPLYQQGLLPYYGF